MKHIGFIGASGLMGHGMAKNLLAKGFQVSLTAHTKREPLQDLLAAGAKLAAHHADLAACDAVIICVTGTPQVEAALEGPQGLLSRARAGLVIVDASTSEPDSTRRLAARCQAVGMTLVDAPLARTPVEAEAGKLNTMVGASPEVFAQLEPMLQAYCENIFHVGETGSAHVIKLLNNFLAQAIATSAAEAFAVGAKAGVDVAHAAERRFGHVEPCDDSRGHLDRVVGVAVTIQIRHINQRVDDSGSDLAVRCGHQSGDAPSSP